MKKLGSPRRTSATHHNGALRSGRRHDLPPKTAPLPCPQGTSASASRRPNVERPARPPLKPLRRPTGRAALRML